MHTPSRVALSLGLVLCLCHSGWANDSTFGGAAGALAPLKESRVRMASEDILLEAISRDYWRVEAKYVFENTTSDDVHLQVGFPELGCMGDCDTDHPFTMNGLSTEVRGKPIYHRTGRIKPENKPVWAPRLGLIHLFDVHFKPHEKVEVVHRYRHASSMSVDGMSVTYLTRTGAFWNGPIGQARFTIRHREKHYYTTHPKDFVLVNRYESVTKEGAMWTYQFEMKNWRPASDLYVFFGNPMNRLAQTCPLPYDVTYAHRDARARLPKGTPDQIDALVAKELFAQLEAPMLRICRNFPYAVHGYAFDSPDLKAIFYPKPTIRTCDDCDADDGMPRETVHFYHDLNPKFDKRLLDDEDRLYIRVAKVAERIYAEAKSLQKTGKDEMSTGRTVPK